MVLQTPAGPPVAKDENVPENTIITERYVDPKTNRVSTRRYLKGKFLGKGGFAKVYEFVSLDSNKPKVQAAKIVPKQNLVKTRSRQKLMSEIKIHRALHHENIVSFEHFFEDEENVYIMLELCNNQSLNDQVKRRKRLTEVEV